MLDSVNNLVIEQFISGAIDSYITEDNKEEALKKYDEIKKHLDKVPDDKLLCIAKINGNISLMLVDKKEISFSKKPTIIDLQNMIEKQAEALRDS